MEKDRSDSFAIQCKKSHFAQIRFGDQKITNLHPRKSGVAGTCVSSGCTSLAATPGKEKRLTKLLVWIAPASQANFSHPSAPDARSFGGGEIHTIRATHTVRATPRSHAVFGGWSGKGREHSLQ